MGKLSTYRNQARPLSAGEFPVQSGVPGKARFRRIARLQNHKYLNLVLQYSHTQSSSTINIYSYDRNLWGAGLEFRF